VQDYAIGQQAGSQQEEDGKDEGLDEIDPTRGENKGTNHWKEKESL
jgi:hypothetical protein